MNFETRHILRWGIPGWYFIVNVFFVILSQKGYGLLYNSQLILPSILVMLLGVPLGFIIYQPYHSLSHIFAKDNSNKWNLLLYGEKKGKRKFLSDRYAYMLTVLHGYGSLISSITISLIFIIIYMYSKQIPTSDLLFQLIINCILLIVNIINYAYTQLNFNKFVNSFLQEKD